MDEDAAVELASAGLSREVVAAIATAAVNAYREQERLKRNAAQRARYARERDRILERERDLRAMRKPAA